MDRKFAKKYVISLLCLYFFGAVFLFFVTLALNRTYDVNSPLSINQVTGIALLLPLLPCASYAGFCMAFCRIKELKKWQKIAICFFFPITLVVITLYGFVMIIPSLIKQIKVLLKTKND